MMKKVTINVSMNELGKVQYLTEVLPRNPDQHNPV